MNLVQLDSSSGLAVLRLNRPPANAINTDLALAIHKALDELETSSAAEPFVFTATGPTFCGGLDLREVPKYAPTEQKEFIRLCNRTAARLYRWPAPVVGAINGHAMAAGFVLALTPDYRVGIQSGARFGIPEIKAGIPFPAVPLTILQHELAPHVVRRLAFTCADVVTEDALRSGIIDETVPDAELEHRGIAVLRDLVALPGDTYVRVKHQVRARAFNRIEDILTTAGEPLLDAWLSAETGTAASNVLKR